MIKFIYTFFWFFFALGGVMIFLEPNDILGFFLFVVFGLALMGLYESVSITKTKI